MADLTRVIPGNFNKYNHVSIRLKADGQLGIRYYNRLEKGNDSDYEFGVLDVGDTTNGVRLVVATSSSDIELQVIDFIHHVSWLL